MFKNDKPTTFCFAKNVRGLPAVIVSTAFFKSKQVWIKDKL